MKRACAHRRDLVAWSRLGCGVDVPPELGRHTSVCSECAKELEEILEVREIAARLPRRALAASARDALRFALMAEARRAPRTRGKERTPTSAWAYGAAAAAVLAVASAVFAFAHHGSRGTAAGAESLATIVRESGAVGAIEAGAPDEIFRLDHGVVHFRVKHLHAGERFRVVSGADVAEVRGTEFVVAANGGQFESVDVSSGRVVVSRNGTAVADLHAGEKWPPASAAKDAPSPTREVTRASASGAPLSVRAPASTGVGGDRADAVVPFPPSSGAPSSTRSVAPSESTSGNSTATAVPSESVRDTAASQYAGRDELFVTAWRNLQGGNPSAASAAFDRLLSDPSLDSSRRGDVLYWSAETHLRSGQFAVARRRADELRQSGGSWHAAEAPILLARAALGLGESSEARRWLVIAAASSDEKVATLARRMLDGSAGNEK